MKNINESNLIKTLELQPCGRYKFKSSNDNQLDLVVGLKFGECRTLPCKVLHAVNMTDELYSKLACEGSSRRKIILFTDTPEAKGLRSENEYLQKIHDLIMAGLNNTQPIDEICISNLKAAKTFKRNSSRWLYWFHKTPSSKLFSIEGIFPDFPAPATIYSTSEI